MILIAIKRCITERISRLSRKCFEPVRLKELYIDTLIDREGESFRATVVEYIRKAIIVYQMIVMGPFLEI